MSLGIENAPEKRAGRSIGELSPQLLSFLSEETDLPELEYASPFELLTGGFDTTTGAFELTDPPAPLDTPLVLRLFRRDDHPLRPQREAAFLNALAAQGFPCPRALIVGTGGEIDGSNFIIMNRAEGSVMGLSLRGLLRMPRVLADIHLRLHALDPEPVLQELKAAGVPDPADLRNMELDRMRASAVESDRQNLVGAVEWLRDRWRVPKQPVVVHGDLHSFNLLEVDGEVSSVLDWGNARIEAAESDVAIVAVIFRAAPVHIPRGLGPVYSSFVRYSTWRYIRLYSQVRQIDRERFDYYRALRSMQALVNGEEAFSGERSQRELRAIVWEVTGQQIR